MPRELMEALTPARVSYKSLLRMVVMPNLEAKVILAWVIWFILRILQSILGPRRRRSRHWLVQYANAVFFSDSDFKIILSNGCLFLLLSCARGAVTMTAFTLGDSDPLKVKSWRVLPWLLYFAWLQWGVIWFDHRLTLVDLYYFTVLCIFPVLYVLLAKPRVAVLDYETKQFADFMPSPPSPLFDHCNANSRLYDCCSEYPFMPKKQKKDDDGSDKWVNFGNVLTYYPFPSGDPQVDICLSYIFSRLLARRYFGFPCAEDGDPQARELILTELRQEGEAYKKVFTIVEVQLALLHDYFFTNFHSDIKKGLTSNKQSTLVVLWVTPLFLAGFAVGFVLAGGSKAGRLGLVIFFAVGVPLALMYLVIVLPNFPVLPSYWHPIRELLLHFSKPTGTPSHNSDHQSSPLHYWREKLGQYSVMEDYDRRSFKKVVIAWCKVHVLSQASYSFMKHNPSEEEDVTVPESLRKFLAETIKDIYGPPNDVGTSTRSPAELLDNQDSRALGDVSWTINLENLTHTILIWHIATSYCHMSQSLPLAEEPNTNHEAATILSRYSAYLVAFLPELLPENALTAKAALQKVLQEATDALGRTQMPMEEKRTTIQKPSILQHQGEPRPLTTFQKGVQLGRQLQEQADDWLRWKTMAVFWAEMILYVAAASSSDKSIAAAHVEQLAQGGEFVTHLWALLCNAGIVIKPPGITKRKKRSGKKKKDKDEPVTEC
ncbi:hypothetical protein BS78_05G068000 [Paspalum vaginatum]|nr:hypothetical protein BS78_05G068000 [Paspalum vaginatum]